jgi:hypothetical protein
LVFELKKKLPNYHKTLNTYTLVIEKINDAINNAKKLENKYSSKKKEKNIIDCNPSTDVYKIIEELIK